MQSVAGDFLQRSKPDESYGYALLRALLHKLANPLKFSVKDSGGCPSLSPLPRQTATCLKRLFFALTVHFSSTNKE